MMRSGTVFALLLILLMLLVPPALADDESDDEPAAHPLAHMLALVPQTAAASSPMEIAYVDYRALEAAAGIERPAAIDPDDDDFVVWLHAQRRMATGPRFLQWIIAAGDETPQVVGFSWLAVDRAMLFGAPPTHSLILGGDPDALTDVDSIDAAFAARGYESEEIDDAILWRHAERDGLEIDVANRNPANPFGGDLGRSEPLALLPGFLLSSPSDESVRDMLAAAADPSSSLAGRPDFAAIAEALGQDELLIQALFYSPQDLGFMPGDPFAALEEEDLPDPTAGYGPLPPYTMAALADLHDADGNDVHIIALAYLDADRAASAAAELAERLRGLTLPTDPNYVLVERFGAEVETAVYESEAGRRAVALAIVRYPSPFVIEDAPRVNYMFGLWVRMIYMRAFYVLAITNEE
jgi:hypothetical protein